MNKLLLLTLLPFAAFASIDAETKAPAGSATPGVPVIGKAYFAFEVRNESDTTIVCTVTRKACMNNLQNCTVDEQTHTIARKGRVRDYGSYVSVPVTYQSTGDKYTTSYIDFLNCGQAPKHLAAHDYYYVKGY